MKKTTTFQFLLGSAAMLALAACGEPPSEPAQPATQQAVPVPGEQPGLMAQQTVLDQSFARAAETYGIPVELLKATSYALTRWYMVPGEASEFDHLAPAYGLFALRGDYLARGAQLASRTIQEVQTQAEANILAAAALLRAEASALGLAVSPLGTVSGPGGTSKAELAAWAPAIAKFSGIPQESEQADFLYRAVYQTLRDGVSGEEQLGKAIRFPWQIDVTPDFREPTVESRGTETVAGYSGAIWKPAPASNYTDGRSTSIKLLVIHTCSGAYSGCLSWLRTPYPTNPNKTSAHYVVNESGSEIAQIVDEADTAHHVGAPWMGSSTNAQSVGIEHGGNSYTASNPWSAGQVNATVKLSCDIVKRNRIIQDRNHIIGHYQPDPVRRADDPGTAFPWASVMTRIATCIGGGGGGGGTGAEIIVDSNQANNGPNGRIDPSASSSAWTSSTSVAGYWGSGYWSAPVAPVSDAMSFEFNLASAERKELFAWWTAAADRSSSTPIVVFNADGTNLGTVRVNQQANGGRWVSLGSFDFTAGWNTVSVSRWTSAGSYVIADAIRVK